MRTRQMSMRLTFGVMVCVGVGLWPTGCLSMRETCWVDLGEAIDRTESARYLQMQTANSKPQRGPTIGDDAAGSESEGRAVSLEEVAAAWGILRRTDDMLRGVDRATACARAPEANRESVMRVLAMQSDPWAARGAGMGTGAVLRTDFVGSNQDAAESVDVMSLVEMASAAEEGGHGDIASSESRSRVTSRPARGPLGSFKETAWRDLKRIHLDLWEDTKHTFWNPTNAIILVTAGGVSLALRPEVDDDVEDYYDHHHTMSDGWRQTFGFLGNPAFHFALAGVWYLTGQEAQHSKTYEVGKTLFSALIINGVSTSMLKLAACTDSPNHEPFAWPSGHTSSAFTVAAVMHEAYGPLAGVPLYGVASMVALSRLDDREHHLSDVVFGAALGWVVGHTVASGHRPQIFGGDVVPYADPVTGTAGVAWFKCTK